MTTTLLRSDIAAALAQLIDARAARVGKRTALLEVAEAYVVLARSAGYGHADHKHSRVSTYGTPDIFAFLRRDR